MRPSDLRDRMLSEHEELRRQLVGIRAALTRGAGGPVLTAEVKAQIKHFSVALAAHMAYEEAHLAPALRASSDWGDIDLDDLRAHHDRQRERLRVLTLALRDPRRREESVVGQVAELLDEVEADVADENRRLLTPRMPWADTVRASASDR